MTNPTQGAPVVGQCPHGGASDHLCPYCEIARLQSQVEELKERIANWQAYDDRGEAILRFKAEQQIPELIRQRDLATSPALSAAHNEITALKARLRMADERGDRWSILAKK